MRTLIALAVTLSVGTFNASIGVANEDPPSFRTDRLIIKVKESVRSSRHAESLIQSSLDRLGLRDAGPFAGLPALRRIDVPRSLQSQGAYLRALKALQSQPWIEYAEPNYIYSAHVIKELSGKLIQSGDEERFFERQWGLHNTGKKFGKLKGTEGADIDMLRAWEHVKSLPKSEDDVTVAVIDTGIDYRHPDLAENIWRNSGENGPWKPTSIEESANAGLGCEDKSCNNIDDDGNGYIDDHIGWNWSAREARHHGSHKDPHDDNMHGTHVAGVIGARHNGIGMAGIDREVKLMALKFLDRRGSGTLEGAIGAVVYAATMDADIINASWGGGGESKALGEAVAFAISKGVLFVAAAGNSSQDNDFTASLPANYEGVLSVLASDNRDQRAAFSSYGRKRGHVAAPGYFIFSTVPNGYAELSGTSMAAPHVAGLAALMLRYEPDLRGKPELIKERLMRSSEVTPEFLSQSASGGRINAFFAVTGEIPVAHQKPDSKLVWSEPVSHFLESAHPYSGGVQEEYVIHQEGASWIELRFGRHSIEKSSDYLEIYDADHNLIDVLTGFGMEATARPIPGDTVHVVFRSDEYVNGWGFELLGYRFAR